MTGDYSDWRLLALKRNSAAVNMAIDEAVLICRSRGEVQNTLRFYMWDPSTVSIGFFQSLHAEVDLDACKREGVDVVRRITGGGAVFHDSEGEVTYSLVVGEEDGIVPRDIIQSYRVICDGIIEGLRLLGVAAMFQPVNDILVAGKKISGNAQTRRLGVVLQHGTILVDADVDKMFNVLRVSDVKVRDKMIASVKDRVTTLAKEMSSRPQPQDVAEALRKGFEKSLKIRLTEGELTEEERIIAERLSREKYMNPEWTGRR
jgi:lipoate-protein ligase A